VKRRQLLQHFGSVQAIREAAPRRSPRCRAGPEAGAQKVLAALAASDPTKPASRIHGRAAAPLPRARLPSRPRRSRRG
jgi:hypothetical protein